MFCKNSLITVAKDFVTSFLISESSKVVLVLIAFSLQNRLTLIAEKRHISRCPSFFKNIANFLMSFPFCENQKFDFIERNNI